MKKIGKKIAWLYDKFIGLVVGILVVFMLGMCLMFFFPFLAYLAAMLLYLGIILLYIFGVVLVVGLISITITAMAGIFSFIVSLPMMIVDGCIWIFKKIFNFGK